MVESAKVIIFAIVETKTLLIDVTEEMERFDANIGSANRALEQAPKVFDSIGMHVATDICFHVVDDVVGVFLIKTDIRGKLIGEKLAFRLDGFSDLTLDCRGRNVLNDLSAHLADRIASVAFQHSHDDSLACGATALDALRSFVLVHVAGLPADIGFIGFDLAGELPKRAGLHCKADAMEHEPSGLLSDAKLAGDLIRANPVLIVGNHPHCCEPFIKADGAIFHDGSDFDGELLSRVLATAFEQAGVRQERHHIGATFWAMNFASRPAESDHILKACVRVGEISYGLN